MGTISSKQDERAAVFLKDQTRCEWGHPPALLIRLWLMGITVTIALLTISSYSCTVKVTPNAFSAVQLTAKRDISDDTPVEYIQVSKSLNVKDEAPDSRAK